jgi:hypothetical protein
VPLVRDPKTGFIEYQPPEPVATGDIPVVPTWLHVKGRCCKDCEVPIIVEGDLGHVAILQDGTFRPVCRACTRLRREQPGYSTRAYRENSARRLDWEEWVRIEVAAVGLEYVLRNGAGSVSRRYKRMQLPDGGWIIDPPTGIEWE